MLINLIKHQLPGIEKNYLCFKDPFKSKYQLLINEWENVGIEQLKISKAFVDYSQIIDYVYENL